MRGSREDLPATMESDQVIVQEAEWADIHVGFETYNEEFDLAPLLRGLPDDMCQCPHYGYVLKGRMRVRYADREEVFEAGDAYYAGPGHTPVLFAGTEVVEFSPTEELGRTMEVVTKNMEEMEAASS
jgi:mannose-6-phosphate isomerase-like protein (cupin superfamily)